MTRNIAVYFFGLPCESTQAYTTTMWCSSNERRSVANTCTAVEAAGTYESDQLTLKLSFDR